MLCRTLSDAVTTPNFGILAFRGPLTKHERLAETATHHDMTSSDDVPWRSASVLSLLAAVISVSLVYRTAEWQVLLPALAFTYGCSWLAMLPGLLAAHGLQRFPRLERFPHLRQFSCLRQFPRQRRLRLAKFLLDFWLPAVVGLVTLDGYVTAVTGRSALFYLNLIIFKQAHRWMGSGGTDANWMLFLPIALTMLVCMLVARLLHSYLRQPATIPAAVWIPGLLLVIGLGAWPYGHNENTAAAAVTMNRDWERPPVIDSRPPGETASPDVVLVVFESLRADALQSSIMPYAFSLAAEGVHFESHYAGSNSSLLGLYGLLHGRPAAYAERDLRNNVPAAMLNAFKQRGYQTAFFCGGDPAGYDEMDCLLGPSTFDVYRSQPHDDWLQGDAWAMSQLQVCLQDRSRPPTLAIVFVMATHFDYGLKQPGPFLPAANDWSLLVPWGVQGPGHDAVVNRYRNAVHAADAVVGRSLLSLRRANTVVAITGDHGQSLYDDGTVAHWSRLSEAQTHVPLIIAGPRIATRRTARPTMHADVAQLLLDGAAGSLRLPDPRPVLLVQSNPGMDYEDWAIIDGPQRTAWRRRGPNITYQGQLDHRGQLRR